MRLVGWLVGASLGYFGFGALILFSAPQSISKGGVENRGVENICEKWRHNPFLICNCRSFHHAILIFAGPILVLAHSYSFVRHNPFLRSR